MAQQVEQLAPMAAAVPRTARQSVLRRVIWMARRKPLGACGGIIILLMLLMAIFAESIAPFHYNKTYVRDRLKPPSATYILGTDNLGRDMVNSGVDWGQGTPI